MNDARKPGESFKQYRLRLKFDKQAEKRNLQGRMIWMSRPPQGYDNTPGRTYIRAQHGEIGSR